MPCDALNASQPACLLPKLVLIADCPSVSLPRVDPPTLAMPVLHRLEGEDEDRIVAAAGFEDRALTITDDNGMRRAALLNNVDLVFLPIDLCPSQAEDVA